MSETYVECLVKSQASILVRFAKYLSIMMTAVLVLLGMIGVWPAFFIAIATGIGAYFAWLNADIEYEYLYLDKELTVDKVMAQTKRKKVATFELERVEILAPIKSYHLDNYKNRQCQVSDFSIKAEEQPDGRYVMFYDGTKKIILSPSPELVKAMKNVAPRKVFMD